MFLGTIGIDIERKLVLLAEKDANIWKSPEIDRQEQEETKKYASKEHKVQKYIRVTFNIKNHRFSSISTNLSIKFLAYIVLQIYIIFAYLYNKKMSLNLLNSMRFYGILEP